MRLLSLAFCAGLICQAADATTYYVSSQSGRDTNAGTSKKRPWKNLEVVNSRRFRPGDRILLQAGSRWRSPLTIRSSGTAVAPIRIDRYGTGPMPRIDAGDVAENAVTIRNVDYVEVRNLELTNRGKDTAVRRGVLIAADNIGTLHGIVVAGLYIHDVNGTNERKDNGGILFRSIGDRIPSRFDGLRIERNIVWRVDRTGITAKSDQIGPSKLPGISPWHLSLNVVIRDNYVEDIAGDGVVPWVTDGALVEHNIAVRTQQRGSYYNAGIWPWNTDNTLLQLNAASFTKGTTDGEGFDSDFNSRDTKFIYNLSRENDGGFMLICAPGKDQEDNFIDNSGTVIRNNISWHDHNRTFVFAGTTSNTLIEDNAVYVSPNENVQLAITADWGGWAKDVLLRGNLFASQGTSAYGHGMARNPQGAYTLAPGWGGATGLRFEGNRFLGNHVDPPETVTPGDASGQAIAELMQKEPRFDPTKPDGFADFLVKHRAWMIALFTRQFGHPPVLEGPARATTDRFGNPQ
jgi:hypothetical protein